MTTRSAPTVPRGVDRDFAPAPVLGSGAHLRMGNCLTFTMRLGMEALAPAARGGAETLGRCDRADGCTSASSPTAMTRMRAGLLPERGDTRAQRRRRCVGAAILISGLSPRRASWKGRGHWRFRRGSPILTRQFLAALALSGCASLRAAVPPPPQSRCQALFAQYDSAARIYGGVRIDDDFGVSLPSPVSRVAGDLMQNDA